MLLFIGEIVSKTYAVLLVYLHVKTTGNQEYNTFDMFFSNLFDIFEGAEKISLFQLNQIN